MKPGCGHAEMQYGCRRCTEFLLQLTKDDPEETALVTAEAKLADRQKAAMEVCDILYQAPDSAPSIYALAEYALGKREERP